MSVQSHLAQLERKHQALDQAIATELAHPSHDLTKIATLKRKKLMLKDEIEKLRTTARPKAGLH
jgi:hypothetical protein